MRDYVSKMLGDPTHLEEIAMRLTFLGTTSSKGQCPNLYETDRDTYVVQGYEITDPEALAALRERGMPDHETAVEIPKALLGFAPRD
ncbi:hypothetical protein [Saccharopolyspora spinosa]|nr:hypothetical protein [Saccharopolyspora spinosa]